MGLLTLMEFIEMFFAGHAQFRSATSDACASGNGAMPAPCYSAIYFDQISRIAKLSLRLPQDNFTPETEVAN